MSVEEDWLPDGCTGVNGAIGGTELSVSFFVKIELATIQIRKRVIMSKQASKKVCMCLRKCLSE